MCPVVSEGPGWREPAGAFCCAWGGGRGRAGGLVGGSGEAERAFWAH